MTARIDLLHRRFGALLVVAPAPTQYGPGRRAYAMWRCVCQCGAVCAIRASHLMRGHTTSCGCQRGAARRTPDHIARKAKELYLSGKTLREVATALHYSSTAQIRVLLHRQGVACRPAHARPRVSTTALLVAYDRLGTFDAVDRQYGLHRGTTCKRLKTIIDARRRKEARHG